MCSRLKHQFHIDVVDPGVEVDFAFNDFIMKMVRLLLMSVATMKKNSH